MDPKSHRELRKEFLLCFGREMSERTWENAYKRLKAAGYINDLKVTQFDNVKKLIQASIAKQNNKVTALSGSMRPYSGAIPQRANQRHLASHWRVFFSRQTYPLLMRFFFMSLR